jgi:acyl-CoA reductase-like NAD-dependent aldehyde dehydrogenase
MVSQLLLARHWIDGEWTNASERRESINPATGEKAIVYDETEEGGYKQSSPGRLDDASAIDDFVECKTIIHEIDLAPAQP